MTPTKSTRPLFVKSGDTEEWLDTYFTRPLGYFWTLFFARLGVHPNIVTILSIFIGVGAGVMFYFHDFLHNVIGVALLVWANIYDSCDGQLARMTHKTSAFGRTLDGFAGDVWFASIYIAIILRLAGDPIPFTQTPWSYWGFILCYIAGVICHARQCQLADYYRNVHLYFMPNGHSELVSSQTLKARYAALSYRHDFWTKLSLYFYIPYTRRQERLTPRCQALLTSVRAIGGCEALPTEWRARFRADSLHYIPMANALTFNLRAITLYIACLCDQVWVYPLVEITLFALLAHHMRHGHEQMCHRYSLTPELTLQP